MVTNNYGMSSPGSCECPKEEGELFCLGVGGQKGKAMAGEGGGQRPHGLMAYWAKWLKHQQGLGEAGREHGNGEGESVARDEDQKVGWLGVCHPQAL